MPVTNADFAIAGDGSETEDIDKNESPWRIFSSRNFLVSFIHGVDSLQRRSCTARREHRIDFAHDLLSHRNPVRNRRFDCRTRAVVLSKLAGREDRCGDQQNSFAAFVHYRRVVYDLRCVFALLSDLGLSYP
jgi:hypothetical protein